MENILIVLGLIVITGGLAVLVLGDEVDWAPKLDLPFAWWEEGKLVLDEKGYGIKSYLLFTFSIWLIGVGINLTGWGAKTYIPGIEYWLLGLSIIVFFGSFIWSSVVRLLDTGLKGKQIGIILPLCILAGPFGLIVLIVMTLRPSYYAQELIMARNKYSSEETIYELASHENVLVRNAAFENTKMTSKLLSKLAKSPNYGCKEGVAGHPKTPVETLMALAKVDVSSVRRAIAKNPNTPLEILEWLSKTRGRPWESYDIKSSILDNPNVTMAIISKLAKDKDDNIRSMALEKLESMNLSSNQSPLTVSSTQISESEVILDTKIEEPKSQIKEEYKYVHEEYKPTFTAKVIWSLVGLIPVIYLAASIASAR
jgi:hypothetical protein